ncbi:hypothetical protein [Bacillus sp. JJ1122]|uniref:hypothetical protein n=1 Tax=Bacillus sp. JJ1122 TaxID=3122951 RepID=UPI003000ADBB
MMKYILIGALSLILLSGCSSNPASSSYASTMMINGDYYDAIGGQSSDYTIDKEIGELRRTFHQKKLDLKKTFFQIL